MENISSSKRKIPPSIYFGSIGCNALFFVGVIEAMEEYWGKDFYSNTMFCGDGIGALIAVQTCLGIPSSLVKNVVNNVLRKMRFSNHYLDGQDYWVNQYIDHLVLSSSNEDLYKYINNKKYKLGITDSLFTHHWVTSWDNNADLAKSLKASSNVPLFSSRCKKIYGEEVINGAFSMTGIDFPNKNDTLFIGMNEQYADITYYTPIWSYWLPFYISEDILLAKGKERFQSWISNNMTNKIKKKRNYIAIFICWIGKYVQLFFEFVVTEIMEEPYNY